MTALRSGSVGTSWPRRRAERRGEARWTARGAWSAPATIFVAICLLAPLAILFRYSLNEFVPPAR